MRTQLPLALVLATTSLTACVDNATDDAATVSSALEQENGGLDTADEAPEFGDEATFAAARIEGDAPVADALESDPEVTAIRNAATATRYRIAILWGQLPPDRNAPSARDWTGALSTSRGAMIVRRTIGFESATDALRPRVQRDVIAFASVTRPFADGLVLELLDPDASAGALSLSYRSVDQTMAYQFDLSQLEAGPIVVDAGDGNNMVVTALREPAMQTDACDHGFLRGRWHALREGLGVYRGLIVNADGEVTGHIRGIWGQRRTGEPVMFGKFIARDGSFRGLVSGTYENGEFRARWMTREGDHGVVGGHYRAAPDAEGGLFVGRWAEASCAQ